jgi:hypothetical protein
LAPLSVLLSSEGCLSASPVVSPVFYIQVIALLPRRLSVVEIEVVLLQLTITVFVVLTITIAGSSSTDVARVVQVETIEADDIPVGGFGRFIGRDLRPTFRAFDGLFHGQILPCLPVGLHAVDQKGDAS